VIVYLHEQPSKLWCVFEGGRFDGHVIQTWGGMGGRPYASIWVLRDRYGITWANEALPGADRYRWDGAEPSDLHPGRVVYKPEGS
jgi:hypothetical protein